MAAEPLNKAPDVTASNSAELRISSADRLLTSKEDKLHGAMSEEAADSTSVASPELTEEPRGDGVTQKPQPKFTQDANLSSISAKLLAPKLSKRLVTNLEE